MIVAQERLADCRPEIEAILETQWRHTGDTDAVLMPNWTLYESLEKAGVFCLMIGREDGQFLAYLAAILHPMVNSLPTKVATVSTYWVEERLTRALLLRRLFAASLYRLKELGAKRIMIETNPHHSCGRILEALGFSINKLGYMLKLEADHA